MTKPVMVTVQSTKYSEPVRISHHYKLKNGMSVSDTRKKLGIDFAILLCAVCQTIQKQHLGFIFTVI